MLPSPCAHWQNHFPLLVYTGEKLPWYVMNRLHRWDCFFPAALTLLSHESRSFLYVSWMEDVIYSLDVLCCLISFGTRLPCIQASISLQKIWRAVQTLMEWVLWCSRLTSLPSRVLLSLILTADWINLLMHLFPLMLFSLVWASWISVETAFVILLRW